MTESNLIKATKLKEKINGFENDLKLLNKRLEAVNELYEKNPNRTLKTIIDAYDDITVWISIKSVRSGLLENRNRKNYLIRKYKNELKSL